MIKARLRMADPEAPTGASAGWRAQEVTGTPTWKEVTVGQRRATKRGVIERSWRGSSVVIGWSGSQGSEGAEQ